MNVPQDKAALIIALRAALLEVEARLKAGQDDASAGMRVDGTFRPSNRGERGAVTTAGYLTQGLEVRLTEVRDALSLLDRLDATPRDKAVTGAWVSVEADDGAGREIFLFPGGSALEVEGVWVVSPESPVGQALWGHEDGDSVTLPALGPSSITRLR